jgi:hypothetical protein
MNLEDEAEMDLGDKKWIKMVWIVIKDMCYQIKKTPTKYESELCNLI